MWRFFLSGTNTPLSHVYIGKQLQHIHSAQVRLEIKMAPPDISGKPQEDIVNDTAVSSERHPVNEKMNHAIPDRCNVRNHQIEETRR